MDDNAKRAGGGIRAQKVETVEAGSECNHVGRPETRLSEKDAEYMHHLDGLRMLALIGVLLFHFRLFGATGGFVGVDIFFVLSGFLITRLILGDLGVMGDQGYGKESRFSLVTFYTRRFWRLYPSSITTIACTLCATRIIFPQELTESVVKSVLASMVSVSNILFYSEAGYWEADSSTKPLLHTWSLGVEEQFYFFWPCLLIVLAKASSSYSKIASHRKSFIVGVLALLTVCSFGLAKHMYTKDPSMAFFLLPARVYEFGLGATCSPLYHYTSKWNGLVWEVVSIVAVIIMTSSFFVLPEATGSVFFGFYSIPVLLSTIVLIMLPKTAVNSMIMSHPLSQQFGKESYTLYLVHWPLWVFLLFQRDIMARIPLGDIPLGFLALALTLLVGHIQYVLVETRFRFRDTVPMIAKFLVVFVIMLVMSSAVLLMSSVSTLFSKGVAAYLVNPAMTKANLDTGPNGVPLPFESQQPVPKRSVTPESVATSQLPKSRALGLTHQAKGLDAIRELLPTLKLNHTICDLTNSAVTLGGFHGMGCIVGDHSKEASAILIGDIMMYSLNHGFDFAGRKLGISLLSFAQPNCKIEAEQFQSTYAANDSCGWMHSNISAALRVIPKGNVVFLSQSCFSWCKAGSNGSADCGAQARKEVEFLKSFGLKVVFVGMPPVPPFDPALCYAPNRRPECVSFGPVGRHFEQDELMRKYCESELGIPYFGLYSWFHIGMEPNNFTYIAEEHVLFKYHFLNEIGSIYVGPRLMELLQTYVLRSEQSAVSSLPVENYEQLQQIGVKPPASGNLTDSSRSPSSKGTTANELSAAANSYSKSASLHPYYKREGLEAIMASLPTKPHWEICNPAAVPFPVGASTSGCILGDQTKHPSAVLIGDWMMYALIQGFHFAGKKLGTSVLSFAKAGCNPDARFYENPGEPTTDPCIETYRNVSAALPLIPAGTTIFYSQLIARWCEQNQSNKIDCRTNGKREIDFFKGLGYHVVFVGNPPHAPFYGNFCPTPQSGPGCIRFGPSEQYKEHNEWPREYIETTLGVPFFDLYPWFHTGEAENNFTYFVEDYLLYRDDHHLTDFGSLYASPIIAELLRTHVTPTRMPWNGSKDTPNREPPLNQLLVGTQTPQPLTPQRINASWVTNDNQSSMMSSLNSGSQQAYYKQDGLDAIVASLPLKSSWKVCDPVAFPVTLGASNGSACLLGDQKKHPSAVLIGDSMMYALTHGFDYAGKQLGISIVSFAQPGCAPNSLFYEHPEKIPNDHCQHNYRNVSAALPLIPAGTTIFYSQLASGWCKVVDGRRKCLDHGRDEIEYFRRLGYNLVFVGNPPYSPFNADFCPTPRSGPACVRFGPTERHLDRNEWVREYCEQTLGVKYWDLYSWFHTGEAENNFTYFVEDYLLFRDNHHLSYAGSLYLAPTIAELLTTSLTPTKIPWDISRDATVN